MSMKNKFSLILLSLCMVGSLLAKEGKIPTQVKSIIEIWVWGGPCHLDSFDPKPHASKDYNGGFKDIPTNVPEIRLSEFLPKLAQHADKFSIIRSMTHETNAHETATYLMQTGRMPGDGYTYPAIGAVFSMMREGMYQGKLPPYISLTLNKGRFSENGFLNEKFKPFATGGNPNATKFSVEGFTPPEGISDERFQERLKLRDQLDGFSQKRRGESSIQNFDQSTQEALSVIQGDGAKTFDVSLESEEVRNLYGKNTLGQSFLVARRLVEAGVPYITINVQGWDSHKRHFETMKQKTAEMDQAFSALLQELDSKGLLDSTIVWWTGEFGRRPKIDWHEPWNGGRNHYGKCFSTVVAGGGFQGGKVIGASDEKGENPIARPVSPGNLLWSIYELSGINPKASLPNPENKPLTILPLEEEEGRLIELYPESLKSFTQKEKP